MASRATPVSRIAIIGVGQVGTAAAYSIILASVATELLIVDVNRDLRDSQVIDLCDVSYCCNSQTTVRAATHQEARESEIVVITAGSKYNRGRKSYHIWLIEYICDRGRSDGGLGETTIQHMYKKISIIRSIVQEMKPFKPDTILLVVTNPVDLLTLFAYELSGLPASQVLGPGTFLDSLRVRNLLAQEIKVRSICSIYASISTDSRLDRGHIDRPLHSRLAWRLTDRCMVRGNDRRRANEQSTRRQYFGMRKCCK